MIISCVSLGFCPPHPSITEWDLKYVSLLRAVEMYSFTSNFSHFPPQKVAQLKTAQALVLFTHSVFRWESVCMPVVWYIWCKVHKQNKRGEYKLCKQTSSDIQLSARTHHVFFFFLTNCYSRQPLHSVRTQVILCFIPFQCYVLVHIGQ